MSLLTPTREARCTCGAPFDGGRDRTCPECKAWVPEPTRAQLAKISTLCGLLGVEGVTAHTPPQATAVIEDLITLCGLDPDIGVCAAEGCEFFVSKRRKTEAARTYCGRHRKQT